MAESQRLRTWTAALSVRGEVDDPRSNGARGRQPPTTTAEVVAAAAAALELMDLAVKTSSMQK